MIIGAFAAGVLLARTPKAKAVQQGTATLSAFFGPLFFVSVGAAVDLRMFNPATAANRHTLWIGGSLLLVAVIGKFAAGYAAPWFKGRQSLIGAAMIPRGEVGLIFAQTGFASGVFDASLFSAVTMVVILTTFLAPLLLRFLLRAEIAARRRAAAERQPEAAHNA